MTTESFIVTVTVKGVVETVKDGRAVSCAPLGWRVFRPATRGLRSGLVILAPLRGFQPEIRIKVNGDGRGEQLLGFGRANASG